MEKLATALEPFKRTTMLKQENLARHPSRWATYLQNQSQGNTATTETGETAHKCPKCKGAGYYYVENISPGQRFGQIETVKCWECYDFLGRSRLTLEEQNHTVDRLRARKEDEEKQLAAMQFICRAMLRNPFGFLSFCGGYGDGKSLVLTALTAEFCRKRVQAQYWHINSLLELIMPFTTMIDGEEVTKHDIDERLAFLRNIPFLAVDEIDKPIWTDWKAGQLIELFDWRYRNADKLVTVFAMNKPPERWAGAERVEHLASRMRDGRFNRPWDSQYTLPPCLQKFTRLVAGKQQHYAPGFFVVNLPDARPNLVRDAQ